MESNREMGASDLRRLFKVAQSTGIAKLKITGGEPLIRDDIIDLVREASKHFTEVSMTTNGVMLGLMANELAAAGLRRINVSLDTVDESLYTSITGVNSLSWVIEGIDAALAAGLTPLKVNTVLLKGLNDGRIPEMVEFASSRGAVLQLIELNSIEGNGDTRGWYFSLASVEKRFAAKAVLVKRNELHDRRRYFVPNNESMVEVEFVRSMGRKSFCMNCTRIRVTSDGMLKPCLMTADGEIDFLTPLQAGASDDDLAVLMEKAISGRKPYWVAE